MSYDPTSTTDRLIERMREVWKATKTAEKCPRCGAPMFKAKSGKLCCADLCWKSAADITNHAGSYGRSRYGRWQARY